MHLLDRWIQGCEYFMNRLANILSIMKTGHFETGLEGSESAIHMVSLFHGLDWAGPVLSELEII